MKRHREKTGFADTKRYPHKGHPANYKYQGNNLIEYITFSHQNPAKIRGKSIQTIELEHNIDKDDRGKSHIVPIVYLGDRSSLGKENKKYAIHPDDKSKVDIVFENAPREKVRYAKPKK